MNDNLEPTKRGGVRRTRVAQTQSAGQISQRSVLRMCPRVLKLTWREPLGLPECPYVIRWRLEFFGFSVRVHHWLSSDDPRAYHDHPWWFVTLVVKGGYADKGPRGNDHLQAPAIRYRPAEHQHTVFPNTGGCWTILITGRPLRKWGFWDCGKFIKANKWFLAYGHHPCKLPVERLVNLAG